MPETTILTHRPSGGFRGNANEMETHNEYMQNIRARMKSYYAHFLEGVEPKDFEEIYRDDTFFNAVAGLKWAMSITSSPRTTPSCRNSTSTRTAKCSSCCAR
jgi:ATP-dependent protease ClpP protease subunit